jgi:DNA-binding SARP family transcriptional activator
MGVDSFLMTLGKFELNVGNRAVPALPTHKARALVAFLVLNRGHDVARERLLELFWSEFEPQRAREGLRTALSTIRRVLRDAEIDPSDVMIADRSVVRWIAATSIDSERFSEFAQSEHPDHHVAAIELYGGDFLEGNYDQWPVAERQRLSSLYETLLAAVVKRSSDTETAWELLARNPYDETAYATLIESELKENRPTAAAELLERYRAAMIEGGAELSPGFEARFESVPELDSSGDRELRVPFVARTFELQRLDRAFRERVGTDGFLALIAGDAGIGKSALVAKAAESARGAGRRVLLVRCTQDDPRRMGAWQPLYERIARQSGGDVSAADAPSVIAREIVASLQVPTVLFVDDAHTLRGDALATFGRVARLARAGGHGVVVASRPEGAATIESLSAPVDDRIELGPLQRSDIQTAVAIAVDAGATSLADTLYERSGGHPLFFVALLQALVQKQALRRERGRWRVVRALDEHLELPQNVRASMDARLHAAGDDAAVVACALALEPSCSAEDLAFALDYPEPRVLDAIDDLLGYGLIREAASSTQYEFSHDIVREVAATILNPGRRVALHREFARRFESSSTPEAKLQLARHYRAAGMATQAALAYLESSQSALLRYAFRDALERADDGVHALERVERTEDYEATLSRLHLIRAQAAANAGEIALAADAADRAVRHARAGAQKSGMANALVVRSSLHGALADAPVQLSDALEASALAGELFDRRLRARAAVEAASATRIAGAAEQALQLSREACETAQQSNEPATLYAAYEELLRSQISWWHFDDARRTFAQATPIAERAGISAQARLSCLQAALAYLLEKPKHASEAVQAALQSIDVLRERGDTAPPDLGAPVPLIAFTAHYLHAMLAAAHGDRTAAFDSILRCKSYEKIAGLPMYANAITLLEIDALLGRNGSGDTERAVELVQTLSAGVPQSFFGWSDSVELARACIAARLRDENARRVLRDALDAIEEQARRMPLDCDRAFTRLAEAADESKEPGIRDRAIARSGYYRAKRTAAAAALPIPAVAYSR